MHPCTLGLSVEESMRYNISLNLTTEGQSNALQRTQLRPQMPCSLRAKEPRSARRKLAQSLG